MIALSYPDVKNNNVNHHHDVIASTPVAMATKASSSRATTTNITINTTTTTATTSKIKLMDIFLMALIHCLIFFIYAHHHNNNYHHHYHYFRQSSKPSHHENDHHLNRHDGTTSSSSSISSISSIHKEISLLRRQLDRFKKKGHDTISFASSSSSTSSSIQHDTHDRQAYTITTSTTATTHYEPDYPKQTRIHEFPTLASEKEMAKHDRYMIHSILYTQMLSQEYLQQHWKLPPNDNRNRAGPWKFEKKVCMVVRVKKDGKRLPYVNAFIMSFMGGHVQGEKSDMLKKHVPFGHRLLSYVDLNLLTVQGDDDDDKDGEEEEDDDGIRSKIFNLNFLKVHHVEEDKSTTTTSSSNSSSSSSSSRRLKNIVETLKSAHICVESGLPWCLLMEEYTIFPMDFLNSLKRFIIAPLESFAASHRDTSSSNRDRMESDGDVFRRMKKMSVISLFTAYNKETSSVMQVHNVEYSVNQYERDRGKINSERKAVELDEYQFQYEMYPIVDDNGVQGRGQGQDEGGYDTAMLFHTSMVESDLIPMLERMKREEEQRIAMRRLKRWLGWLSNDDEDVWFLDVEREISLQTGIKRYSVEPSLVNRIGFYDPDFTPAGNDDFGRSELGITNWLTDPRFLFEPGDYYEGIDEYCEMEDGSWIWDGLYDHRTKSCCDDKFAKDERCLE
eukprot:CAMPEP_0176499220 /NCGR_PEP_ID=MMETSP0200_2-20121128/12801_1 /TAXON_ID=947934 /ORGANISM="Chaetoceros sp., Strain GSL56" /LENGTH=672 /DNA_ID=CAMNT_0017897605 /DNA_START=48 /DNA_END=2064 /DNA_ORIENTATION=+